MSKLKKEISWVLSTGVLYLMFQNLEVKIPEYERIWLIFQAVTFIAFVASVFCLMVNSKKK